MYYGVVVISLRKIGYLKRTGWVGGKGMVGVKGYDSDKRFYYSFEDSVGKILFG